MLNKKILLVAFTFLTTLTSFAQASASNKSQQDGFMRSEGKIYVVMAVVLSILFGLILFILRLDRKLSKLEKGRKF